MIDIKFTNADLELFSAVSHDVNPLHMDADYARRTPFGEPVVFGVLGALATVQHTPTRETLRLDKVALLFLNPMFVGINYRVEVTTNGNEDRVQVFDGRKRILQATFTYQEVHRQETHDGGADVLPELEPTASRRVPADWNDAGLAAGFHIDGLYMPPGAYLERFMQLWQLTGRAITASDVAALIWTSYVVGMELPGKQAAYSRLEMTLFPLVTDVVTPFAYHIDLVGKDSRFDLLQLKAKLFAGETLLADAQIWATMRADARKSSVETLMSLLPESDRLRGRLALIIGGSRGLGAALVQALALQGCTVLLNYARSHEEAHAISTSLPPSAGKIHLFPGDAADLRWCETQCDRILEEFGGLDLLVCNASPPIRPLDFSSDTLDRFYPFVDHSLRLVATPMAAFAEPLKRRQGKYVVISSLYAKTTPADFPHYVVAKSAIEGLMHAVCIPNKAPYGILVRPPKLLTDQTNTAVGKRDTLLPEHVAATVVSTLMRDISMASLQVIDDFSTLTNP